MILNVKDKVINYRIFGTGRTILLVHGWGGSINSLTALGDLLAAKNKVILIDLPGFGSSEKPNPDWGVEEYTDLLAKTIAQLKIRPVVYFGHSFGGALGINLAVKYPTYIKKLIISGASYQRKKPTSTMISQLLKRLPTFIKIVIYRIFIPESDLYKVPDLEKNFRKIVTQDLTSRLVEISQPTLILWGENDLQTPVSLADEAKSKIKQAKLKIYKNIGHNLPLKHPELVAEEIEKFL